MSPPRTPPAGRRTPAATARSRAASRRPRAAVAPAPTAVNPPALGVPRGFTHGWLAPAGARLLFVAGQTATDASGRVVAGGLVEQFDAALARVLAVVAGAGGRPEHVLRMTVYVTDLDAYLSGRRALGAAWKRRMGAHFPAMALVEVSRLVDEGAVVEIEATAAVWEEGRG